MATWLLKSEPDVYSIDDLSRDGETPWEGVRNYQARNFLREMKLGDLCLFHHSNADPPGVAGVCKVVKLAYPDPTQWDKKSPYYDETAPKDDPRWFRVDVGFVERFPRVVPLEVLKADKKLDGMELLRKGSRLSVQSVSKAHFDHVVKLGRKAK